jgi:DNA-binding transcriptional LysR family regulator
LQRSHHRFIRAHDPLIWSGRRAPVQRPCEKGFPMELRQLRYFLAVAEEFSFTRAGQRLFASQSTISQQVHALERELGCALFVRNARHVELSSAGAALLAPAQQALDAAARVVSTARRAVSPAQEITLAVLHDSAIPAMLVDALRRVLPDCAVHIRRAPLLDYGRILTCGEVDALVGLLPLNPELVTWRVLAEENLVLAVRADHRLADAENMHVADVLDEPMAELDKRIPRKFTDYWTLGHHRNDEPPPRVGPIASCPEDVGSSVIYHGAAAVTFTSMAMPVGLVHQIPLVGAKPCQVVLAHRREDHRPVITALDAMADAVAAQSRLNLTPGPSTQTKIDNLVQDHLTRKCGGDHQLVTFAGG